MINKVKYGASVSISTSGGISISNGVAFFPVFSPQKPNPNSNEVYSISERTFKGISSETLTDGERAYFYIYWNGGYPIVERSSSINTSSEYIEIGTAWRLGNDVYFCRKSENFIYEEENQLDQSLNEEYLSGIFGAPQNGDSDNVILELSYPIEITKLVARCDAGTATIQLFSESRQIGQDLSVSATKSSMVPSSSRVAMEGEKVSVNVLNQSSASNVEYQINYRKLFGPVQSKSIAAP